MEAALETLDAVGAPTDVGSHLDLAICRLEKLMGAEGHERNVQALRRQVEEALLASMVGGYGFAPLRDEKD